MFFFLYDEKKSALGKILFISHFIFLLFYCFIFYLFDDAKFCLFIFYLFRGINFLKFYFDEILGDDFVSTFWRPI